MENEWKGTENSETSSTNGIITEEFTQASTDQGFQPSQAAGGNVSPSQSAGETFASGQSMGEESSSGQAATGEAYAQYTLVESSNWLFGTVGALFGSLLGVALWIIIYQLGYLAGIAGAVTVVCAMVGYEKLGKKLDVKGVIISVIISIVMIYFAHKLAVSIGAYREFQDMGMKVKFSDIYRDLYKMLEAVDGMKDYYRDLFVGYALFLVGGVSSIANAWREARH